MELTRLFWCLKNLANRVEFLSLTVTRWVCLYFNRLQICFPNQSTNSQLFKSAELIVSPHPAFTFRSTGGILDVFFFTGLQETSSFMRSIPSPSFPLFREPDPLQSLRDELLQTNTRQHSISSVPPPDSWPNHIVQQYWRLTLGPQGIQLPAYWAFGYQQVFFS